MESMNLFSMDRSVADPDLQMEGGRGRSPGPWDKGVEGGAWSLQGGAFGSQFGLKIRGRPEAVHSYGPPLQVKVDWVFDRTFERSFGIAAVIGFQ